MKNLAPSVVRQRLLIEATYKRDVTQSDVEKYLKKLPEILDLRIYADPIVYSPGGKGEEINQGYDGFVALIDSGISIYVWESVRFLSVVIYACKHFNVENAVELTRRFFDITKLEKMEF